MQDQLKPANMRRFYHLAMLVWLSFNFAAFNYAQTPTTGLVHHLTVFNAPPDLPIVLIETSTFERKEFRLDSQGKLTIELSTGEEWAMNVGEMRNYNFLNVPQSGFSSGSSSVTYNPQWWNRINQPPTDRSLYQVEDIPVRLPYNQMPNPTHELLEIVVVSKKGTPFMGMEVKVICFALGESYSTTTDDNGAARFLLPLNQQYQIDIDGESDVEFHDTGTKAVKRRLTVTWETMLYKETMNEEGYIEQTFLEDPKPVSGRVFVALNVVGGPNDGVNEDVYLEAAYTGEKYYAKTNANGRAYFLLPKAREYIVNFKYQPDAGGIDLKRFYGIGQLSTTVAYVPDERLQFPERFLPTADEVPYFDINAFNKTTYPDTDDDDLINVHVKFGNNKINSGSREALLELGFSVKEPKEKKAIEKPLNIAFVLDKSGSMMGEKIDILKKAMFEFIEKLRPIDHVSIVFFNTEAVVAYASAAVNKVILKDIVGACKADGGTSIYEGLKLGYEEVKKNITSNSVNRLILLTDGYGSKPIDEVLELSKTYFEKGISVSTIGVGEGYNSALLSLLSKYSGGLEHQAIDAEGMSEALEQEFESLLYPLASDLKVKVKYNNRIVYSSLYGIPEDKHSDGMVQFKLDRVYSSLNRMVLMKFKLVNPAPDIEAEKISIHISYYDEVKQEQVEKTNQVGLEWDEESDVELVHDNNLRTTYSVAMINQMLKVLADQCDAKDYAAARKTINETLDAVKKINRDQLDPELVPLIDQIYIYLKGVEQAYKNAR